MICTGIVVVFDGSINSAANSVLRMQAFEVARENMERLLASSSVKESVEYGFSEKYPAIEWQSTVETFFEPITTRLWAKAVCSADYIDIGGRQQNVEITNWITDLTQLQVLELLKRKQQQKEQLTQADRLLETIDDAAEYADVDVDTVQRWVDNGMPVTEDGSFIKDYLDLYKKTGGNPPLADKSKLDNIFLPLIPNRSQQPIKEPQTQKQPDQQSEKSPEKDLPKPSAQEGNTVPAAKACRPADGTHTLWSPSVGFRKDVPDLWKFLQNCPELL